MVLPISLVVETGGGIWMLYCDETWTPLLDQGLVEVSGSFALLTFAFEKIRADSSS
jgi:hypothetical protein